MFRFFENIHFHYGRESGVIQDLSLLIRPGEKVGLVGRSGAGKSTLVNLLLRFHDLEGGRMPARRRFAKPLGGRMPTRSLSTSWRGSAGSALSTNGWSLTRVS